MSISVNWELIENNFDLVRKFKVDETLLARADHRLFSGFINKMWYTPASTVDIEWTAREVTTLQFMPIDRKDEKNESLLILQGKVTNLDYFFREGIRRFNEAHPPAVLNTEAPKPPALPQPGAKKEQVAVWRKNSSGKKVLTIVEHAPRPSANVMDEMCVRVKDRTPLDVDEFERNLKISRANRRASSDIARPIQEILMNDMAAQVTNRRDHLAASETEIQSEITSLANRQPITATSADSEGED